MAGHFTRRKYDSDEFEDDMYRSTYGADYRLDPVFSMNSSRRYPREQYLRTDIEDLLRGSSNVRTQQGRVPTTRDISRLCNRVDMGDVRIEGIPTRLSHPASNVRGLNVPDLALGYPLEDPQCRVLNDRFGVNTRDMAKDNHVTKWDVPWDQSYAFPTERLGYPKPPNYHRR